MTSLRPVLFESPVLRPSVGLAVRLLLTCAAGGAAFLVMAAVVQPLAEIQTIVASVRARASTHG